MAQDDDSMFAQALLKAKDIFKPKKKKPEDVPTNPWTYENSRYMGDDPKDYKEPAAVARKGGWW